jgi:phosphotriesterase-related protein
VDPAIHTVLGPIAPAQLGVASMHEHLGIDARILHAPSRETPPADPRVTLENLGYVRWNLLALPDNLVIDDPELVAGELGFAAELGQRAVVDLSGWGLGAKPAALGEIARRCGMHVVAGCGVYLDRPHPDWILALDVDGLAQRFVTALEDELEPDCGFRAGLLGIIGTSATITPSELRVIEAAGAAAAQTGAAVTIRLDPATREGVRVLELLAAAGCPARQVVFGNVDEFLDLGYLAELAAGGATLEWCFGNEAYYRDGYKDPTDAERLAALVALLADAPELAAQCVLGCSVWTKSQLRAYGGMGYDHLVRRIVPELERRGVPRTALDAMLVDNPARILAR